MNGRPFSVHPVADYWQRCAVWQVVGESKRSLARLRKRKSAEVSLLERQAERLSDVVGLAQPPPAAFLRAAARTHSPAGESKKADSILGFEDSFFRSPVV